MSWETWFPRVLQAAGLIVFVHEAYTEGVSRPAVLGAALILMGFGEALRKDLHLEKVV